MSSAEVRQLMSGDAAAFRAIRLEGLQTNPEAFGSTYEAESTRPIEEFERTLARSHIVGAHVDGALAGVAGFYVLDGPKTRHRGNIWGVYVREAHRGTGIGRVLIEALLHHARIVVRQVHLTVVTNNASARSLYERLGFTVYGTEPRSLMVGDRFFDEHLMVRVLDEAAS
jgi:ribosomal protein S18 acetylase RimI-like enzyme